jgi:hypothetical protein
MRNPTTDRSYQLQQSPFAARRFNNNPSTLFGVVAYLFAAVLSRFRPLPPKRWGMRMDYVGLPSDSEVAVTGGFFPEGKRFVFPITAYFPFKGEPEEMFVPHGSVTIELVSEGSTREVAVDLAGALREPFCGEFWLSLSKEGVHLRMRRYTGHRQWSIGTNAVTHELGPQIEIARLPWSEPVAY